MAAAWERAVRLGAMQDWSLRVTRLIDHAEREHGDGEVVTAWADENFRGPSLRFSADTGPTQFRETGTASIESVEITCR